MFNRLLRVLLTLSPWMVIAGLAFAALFIKPSVNPTPLDQPLIENRDAFFDGAVLKDQLWIVGQNGAMLSSDDAGSNWAREELPGRENLQAIAVSDQGQQVVVGNLGHVWTRQNDQPWQSQDLLVSDLAGKLLDVSFINGQFWIVGEMGALFRADPTATQWQAMGPEEDVTFNSIRPGVDGDIWITAEFGRLLRSRDNGLTWTTQELGSESLRAIVFDGTTGVAVGNQGQAFISYDAGDSWTEMTPFTQDHLFDIGIQRGMWVTTGDRGALFRSQTPAGSWQAWTPQGLDKSYHNRLLATADGMVLIGHQIGLLRQDNLQLWPGETQQ